jgi:hypothetical protein
MKAFITSAFNTGLGDTYSNIYRIYDVQEQLKKIGYSVSVIVELGHNPYKTHGYDREIFKRIFKLDKLDNLEIIVHGLESKNIELSTNYVKSYNYEHIYTIFIDEKIDEFDNIHHMKHSWYYRDDLPKINFLSDEVTEYAENMSKKIGDNYIGLHYRPFSSDNEMNLQSDLDYYKDSIDSILIENKDSTVFVSTNKNILKDYLRGSDHKNYYINDFEFTINHEGIRSLMLDDDELFIHLKETLSDMYCLSKCEKIYRYANWFSGFLFFSCTYNQTEKSNRVRFIPEQSVIPI